MKGGETPIVFSCDGHELVGILHDGGVDASVGTVIVVGGPQFRVGSHRQFVYFARRIAAAGFPVLRFDVRGMGDSEGSFQGFESMDDDIRAAIDTLIEQRPTLERVVLLGLCDAASASMMYAPGDKRVGGLILLNPWARTDSGEARAFLRHYYFARFLQKSFWRKVLSGQFGMRESIKDIYAKIKRVGKSKKETHKIADLPFLSRMEAGAGQFDKPILLLISGRDLTAAEFLDESGKSEKWRRRLGEKSVATKTFPAADHTMSNRGDLEQASSTILNWFNSQFPS